MRLELTPFDPQHLVDFQVQPEQGGEFEMQREAPAFGEAWTAFHAGQRICSAGLMPLWPGRAMAWALLSVHAGPHMLELTRIARFTLDTATFDRIEMYVQASFSAGIRWAQMLGFERETFARKFLPGGRDAIIFVRV